MTLYEVEEVLNVRVRVGYCLYAYLMTIQSIRAVIVAQQNGFVPDPQKDSGELIRFYFFRESFHVHLSELYSFFHKKKDEKILNTLELDAVQRGKHREARHGYTHIGSGLFEALGTGKELIASTGALAETNDMIKIIKYSKLLLGPGVGEEEYIKSINDELREILGFFPPDFIKQEIIEDILDDYVFTKADRYKKLSRRQLKIVVAPI
ncbi:MAG: hypothetical protein ACREL1_01410 [bacterium]